MSFPRKARDLLIALLATWLIPGFAVLLALPFQSIASAIDPAGAFAWISIHHVFQLILTVLAITLLFRGHLADWGFNLRERRLSLKIFGVFCVIYLVPVFFYNVLPYLRAGQPPTFGFALTPGNITGVLGFQFLLSGTCEEPLFRGLVMTILARSWKEAVGVGRFTVPVSALWATLFFMLAHLKWSFSPFSVSASFWQQAWSFGLGLFYAVTFARTGSLLTPILAHGYANGIIFVILLVMAALMR